uniref:TGB1 n=1 Tax=Ferula potexvirus 1 TaxID=2794414 RepID=A0A7T5UFA1_9VIRU|nr:TGB1 [Ferula potexvirus 1]
MRVILKLDFRKNIIYKTLVEAGWERTALPISYPLVVHGVAGSGKSRVIRPLKTVHNIPTYTLCVTDNPRVDCSNITALPTNPVPGFILDEYHIDKERCTGALLVLGDPLQSHEECFPPHFVSFSSFRIGRSLASLFPPLVSVSPVEDSVEVANCWTVDPVGTILCFEPEVADLLLSHNLEFTHPDHCRGAQFNTVTLYTSSEPLDPVWLYLSVTRHTTKLLWLCPDAIAAPR